MQMVMMGTVCTFPDASHESEVVSVEEESEQEEVSFKKENLVYLLGHFFLALV